MINITMKCGYCHNELTAQDIECNLCHEKELEEYAKQTIEFLIKEFLKSNRDIINHPTMNYDPQSFSSPEEMEIFLRGARSALNFAKISIIVDCLDYDVDLQYLYDDKVNA